MVQPKCRRPIGNAAALLSAILFLSCCATSVFAQGAPVAPIDADSYEELLAKAKKVSAGELFKAYEANKAKFERDRTGQTFIVSGRIIEVRKGNVSNSYIVALEVPGTSNVVKVVYPENIYSVEREYISLLEKGSGFEAFVVGRLHYEFVDAACTKYSGQLRTVRFAAVKIEDPDSDEAYFDGEI